MMRRGSGAAGTTDDVTEDDVTEDADDEGEAEADDEADGEGLGTILTAGDGEQPAETATTRKVNRFMLDLQDTRYQRLNVQAYVPS